MARMRLTVEDSGRVAIDYVDIYTGESCHRRFGCPDAGGYVREYQSDGREVGQVCDQLSGTGDTLTAPGRGEALAKVIRREYRAMRRAEARR